MSSQVPTRCSRCNKRLGPQVIRVESQRFHLQCFTCDKCKKPLGESFNTKGNQLFHPDCFKQQTGLSCAHCRKLLDAQWVERTGRKYHPECYEKFYQLKCKHCNQAITGQYTKDEAGRYHPECYEQLHQLFCAICNEPLRGQYIYDLWGHKAHPRHPEGPTVSCHVCGRLLGSHTSQSGKTLADGRSACGLCLASELRDPRQIQQAKLEVIRQMQAVGFDYIPDYIRIYLSEDQQLLNQRLQASPTANVHGFTRTAERHIPNYGLMLEHSISILDHLPKIAFMGVLAHELLHVWINERPLKHLTKAQVEGFCNLGTALMYRNEGSALAKVLQQRMEEDPDPVYGDGYRTMAARLEQIGWPALLKELQHPPT